VLRGSQQLRPRPADEGAECFRGRWPTGLPQGADAANRVNNRRLVGRDHLARAGPGGKDSPAFYRGEFSPDGRTNTGTWTYPGGGYRSSMTRDKTQREG
jgi:hypothetical protein